MKFNFQLPDFPDSIFELEASVWSGKSKLYIDNIPVEQAKEKGKPYLIPTPSGSFVKAYPKKGFPDLVPTFEINGKIHLVAEKLSWYQYLIGGLPILLIFQGGMIGGALGAVGMFTNYGIFREESSALVKYLKIMGITIGIYAGYFLLAIYIQKLINS